MRRIILAVAISCSGLGAVAAETDHGETGKQIYQSANCVGCHKWSGVGGGGYGGSALSLRATQLSFGQIVETVTCGRPGTGMPHFTADPYGARKCYGLSQADVTGIAPPAANVVLSPPEIEDVAHYVIDTIKGKGDPTLADCVDFFGDSSRVCDIYRLKVDGAAAHHALPVPETTQ